ncbi:MAG: hypothetical protein ACM3ML_29050 [Micromonosporaceae bacterium]
MNIVCIPGPKKPRCASFSVWLEFGSRVGGRRMREGMGVDEMADVAAHYAFPHTGADERRRLDLFAEPAPRPAAVQRSRLE